MIKMKKQTFVLTIIGVILATLLAACGGYYVFTGAKDVVLVQASDYEELQDMSERYGKLYAMQNTINEKFLWETDEAAQMDAMYKALVESLGDKYSAYMTAEEAEKWNRYVTGVFTGVGITFVQNKKGQHEITSVMDGGPADVSGLMAGDIILKVDGKGYETSDEVVAALQGEEGSQVKITYERKSKTRTVSVVRGEVSEQSVYAGIIDDKYGYIQITAFENDTADQFKTELANFENKKLSGLIIDLRDNPGGIMGQSVEIADMLLPECTILHTEDRNGETEYYNSDEKCTKLKYVLLVDENTASAAEILAAAVKDNGGGLLVGVTTFGKGIIQSSMEFSDKTALRLTTMQYLSPKNHQIHEIGVEPDYQVKQSAKSKTDKQLEKAISLLKE